MQKARNLKEYRGEIRNSLGNDVLRANLDAFAKAYRQARENAFSGMDATALIREIAQVKDEAAARQDELLAQFTARAEAAGVRVHLARDAAEANAVILDIARKADCRKIIKSKSMTAEEIFLNHALEGAGLEVTETDLGEWIIQLRREGPSHMVLPAIHLSRHQVKDLFSGVTGRAQTPEIEKLVKVARRELRRKFIEADMGVSGANFALADSGAVGLVTNEGNARLATTLPRVHVALFGLDKILPGAREALTVLKALPRNATAQAITSYVTWISGANACAASPTGAKEIHFVILDNGRSALAKDPVFSQVLRCVRCGACANVCPVYRLIGGHTMGHVYIGAIGVVLTYLFHGPEKASNLAWNCLGCGACKEVCAADIDLPALIAEVRSRLLDQGRHPLANRLARTVLGNRGLFHALLTAAEHVQKPLADGKGFLRHLPLFFFKEQGFRTLPAMADTPLRHRWPSMAPAPREAAIRVGLFAGCLHDFVYPEQAEAGVGLFAKAGASVDFPMGQSCCGLPLEMIGEKQAARDLAAQNVRAFAAQDFTHIVTLCASCASHLKHAYPRLLAHDPDLAPQAAAFSEKVIDFSSFAHDVLKFAPAKAATGPRTAYHAPCHLCRGLGVHDAPRELIAVSGCEYVPADEEETCCGFGGSYSLKFPELSAQMLAAKLDNILATGATQLATDCPGCIMQLRGGLQARRSPITVRHIAEILAGE